MKRLLLPLLVISLAACGGSEDAVTCAEQFWDGEIGTCLPEGWIVMNRETLRQRGVPEEVVAAFQSEKSFSGQFPTVSITKEPLIEDVEPAVYSETSVRAVEALKGYTKVDARSIQIDGDDVTLHVFTATPRSDDPERRFYQVSTTHGSAGYTVSATVPFSVGSDLEAQVLLILEHVTFLPPQEE